MSASEKRVNKPAIGKKLRPLYIGLMFLFVVLVANSLYLGGITFLEWLHEQIYQNYFYQVMFLLHLLLGILFVFPLVAFIGSHWRNTHNRRNRRAVRVGYALSLAWLGIIVTGFLLVRLAGIFEIRDPVGRSFIYWLHVGLPLAIVWLYCLHRLVGPKLRWRLMPRYVAFGSIVLAGMVTLHFQDPRTWDVAQPESGKQYFEPSLSRTSSGNFIPAKTMMMDHYCQECHQDVHDGWSKSVHRFSSFNNPAYLATIRETRNVAMERDETVQASRWCAGCHDPVPFFSGAFDDPEFDDIHHATSQAGITCTSCHAITEINSVRGNGDYVIEEPQHYPLTYSENPVLQWVNRQLVKAKPEFHKKTFLKPLHKTTEFCSVCHKVSLPFEVTHYKEFLRGQNHYDSFLISGISGHTLRSFYYPAIAEQNCNNCHMPLQESDDFGADYFDDSGLRKIHDHLFPGANTGIAWLKENPEAMEAHKQFMQQDVMRVDLFALRKGTSVDAPLVSTIRPELPLLEPGESYLVETVLRALRQMGHHFTQGTVDSNQIWLEVTVKSGDRLIAASGLMNEDRRVDEWAHFVNVFMLDKNGNRISRRNAQDIFTPLYNNQLAPGTGQTVHYQLRVPEDVSAPIEIAVKLKYRKFDSTYMDFIAKSHTEADNPLRGYEPEKAGPNPLPIVTLAEDRVVLPVKGVEAKVPEQTSPIPHWQRWNDYGIGLLFKGKSQLKQAAEAFQELERLDRYDGPLNLARVYFREGRLEEAGEAVARAAAFEEPPAPRWSLAWLSGIINRQQGHLEEAARNLESALFDMTPEMVARGFDFSIDYVVLNELAQTYFDLAKRFRSDSQREQKRAYLEESLKYFQQVLEVDPENVSAHYGLQRVYAELGDAELAKHHRQLHSKYKPDDNARDRAIALARKKHPAANHASEPIVIYDLHRQLEVEMPTDLAQQRNRQE